MSLFFAGLGFNALITILDRVTKGDSLTRDDIHAEIEAVLNNSNIQEALKNPEFVHEFADYSHILVYKL